MTRILMIATGYLPYLFSENLCNAKLVWALREAGVEVDVISKHDEGPTYGCEWTEPWVTQKDTSYEVTYATGSMLTRLVDAVYSMVVMDFMKIESIRWARRAYEKALELMKANRYDAVLTRSPNDVAHLVGYKLKKKTGIRWIANWNDPAAPIWPYPYKHNYAPSEQHRKEMFTEKMLRAADINTFPSDSLRKHFTHHFQFLADLPTEVVPHIGMTESLISHSKRQIINHKSSITNDLTLCHSGNMSGERNPEKLFTAMRQLIDESWGGFHLDIMGHANPQIQSLIKQYGLEDHVACIGSYGYLEAVSKLCDYDVLVLLEAVLERGIFFASKFTDYAQAGRPILAISPTEGFAHDTITAHGGGLLADNTSVESIRSALSELMARKQVGTLDELSSTPMFDQFSPERVVGIYKHIIA